jgi:hypothetical protein
LELISCGLPRDVVSVLLWWNRRTISRAPWCWIAYGNLASESVGVPDVCPHWCYAPVEGLCLGISPCDMVSDGCPKLVVSVRFLIGLPSEYFMLMSV